MKEDKINERVDYITIGGITYIVSAKEKDSAKETPLDIVKRMVKRNKTLTETRYLKTNQAEEKTNGSSTNSK